MNPGVDVLGATYFGPVAGSPLIPPEIITIYFGLFLGLLILVYIFLYLRRRPVEIRHKIKLLVLTALAIKLCLIIGGGLLALFWLLPTPNISQTSPLPSQTDFPITERVEIVFDRPVNRLELIKSITPETPGLWMFDDSLYTTHLYRKLVFIPTQSLKADTEYKIKLSNVKNILSLSSPADYDYSFKTQILPKVASVLPGPNSSAVDINQPIVVNLTSSNNQVSQFDFELTPTIELETKLDPSQKSYILTPKQPLKQGTNYHLVVKKTDLTFNLPTNTVIKQESTTTEYDGSFTTREAPGLSKFNPSGDNVPIKSPITITFSQPMDRTSVEKNFSITPKVSGSFKWTDDSNLNFTPSNLINDTQYTVTLKQGIKAKTSGFLEADIHKSFTTIGGVKVSSFYPTNGWTAAAIDSVIKVEFNQAVDQTSAQSKFSITPSTPGAFSWAGNTLIFKPSSKLPFNSHFTVTLSSGIKSVAGLDSKQQFLSSFDTQQQTVKLDVPAYLQRHTLSCELAALRMALNFRGAGVSEETLLEQVGVDSTPHQGDVWGNPNSAFVGNVNGNQMKDGYGVHWGPIARVAKLYRSASEFSNWSVNQLTEAIAGGNPVVIWIYSSGGWPTSWKTPDGQSIYAVRDEHAVTVVGFVGPSNNPSQLIINDPLHGQVYWTRALFDKKWQIFNNSGVVVY